MEFAGFAPICDVPTNGNATIMTATFDLERLRAALLALHKTLLEAQRVR